MEIYENVDDLFLDGEIWKDIDGYFDYQVSNFGRIKSLKFGKEKILKSGKSGNNGYLFVNLYKNGKKKPKSVHKLEFETFNNYKLKKSECLHHIDKNKLDNDLDNFELMVNFDHNSLHKSGENCPASVLTEQDIIKIKKLLNEGVLTQKEIAKMFGVHESTISAIKNKKSWKHIK